MDSTIVHPIQTSSQFLGNANRYCREIDGTRNTAGVTTLSEDDDTELSVTED